MPVSPLRNFLTLRIFDDAWSRLVQQGVLPRRWQTIRMIRRGYQKFLRETKGDTSLFDARLFTKAISMTEELSAEEMAILVKRGSAFA